MTENITQCLNEFLDDNQVIYDTQDIMELLGNLQDNLSDKDAIVYKVIHNMLFNQQLKLDLNLPQYTQPQILDTLLTLKDNVKNKYLKALAYNSLILYEKDKKNQGKIITLTIELFYDLALQLYNEIKINDDWKIHQSSDFLRLLKYSFTLARTYNNNVYMSSIKLFIPSALKEINNEIIFRNLIGLLKEYKLKEITQDIRKIVKNKTKYFLSIMFEEKEYQRMFMLIYVICGFCRFIKDYNKTNLVLRYQAIIYQKEIICILHANDRQKYTKVHDLYGRALDQYTLITKPSRKIRGNILKMSKLRLKYAKSKSSEYNTFSVDIKLDMKDYDNACTNIEAQNNNIPKILLNMTRINLSTLSYLKENHGQKQSVRDLVATVYHTEDGKTAINNSKSIEIEKVYQALPPYIIYHDMVTGLYRNYLSAYDLPDDLWSSILSENFLKNNIILPQNQIETCTQAIIAGLKGNFIVSSYIIPSLIESMLRNILERADKYAWKRNNKSKDLQEEDLNINQFLGNDEYKKIFSELPFLGEDIVFYLEYLLVAKIGVNFRNVIYHGSYNDDDISDHNIASKFLWWIFIKIIVQGKIHAVTKDSL